VRDTEEASSNLHPAGSVALNRMAGGPLEINFLMTVTVAIGLKL
jgi:hypothetical protein